MRHSIYLVPVASAVGPSTDLQLLLQAMLIPVMPQIQISLPSSSSLLSYLIAFQGPSTSAHYLIPIYLFQKVHPFFFLLEQNLVI
mmetsp:Transcript_8615/g.17568  ORF Transcript_8615/g.17568 Transcript_8615/m.17568 type:complete len:85 (-) Transcript_8615:2239-2493(-)